MADTGKCFSLIRGRVMRVTRLDGCGGVVLGPTSQVVSDGFVTVGLTAQTDEGTTISVTNAAGDVCILDEPAPKFTGYAVEISFCNVNPDLYSMLTGQETVYDDAEVPLAVGFRMNTDVNADDSGFALELWSSVPTGVCDSETGVAYGYFLIPFLKGGVLGDFTIANDAITFTMTGAKSKDGNAWGEGPFNVVEDGDGDAVPLLVEMDPNDHLNMQLTTVAPPEAADCGLAAVGTLATIAVGGIPGTFNTPLSYAPATLAAAIALGLSFQPSPDDDAWTVGQYVTMRDGAKISWDGDGWVAGPA